MHLLFLLPSSKHDVSKFYIYELMDAISSLKDQLKANNKKDNQSFLNKMPPVELETEIVRLNDILQAWQEKYTYSEEQPDHLLITDILVKEFLYDHNLDTIQILKKVFYAKPDCLYANPEDCVSWGLKEKNIIKYKDDYGIQLDPAIYHFNYVSSGNNKVYRERIINPSIKNR